MKCFRITFSDPFEPGIQTNTIFAYTKQKALEILFNDLGFVDLQEVQEVSDPA